jgi:ethanolamine ammonia-lyase small subunit
MSQIEPIPQSLRNFTPARVSLPTAGDSIATSELLNFQLAHARARDAVHAALHLPSFAQRLVAELPIVGQAALSVLQLRSNATDRIAYLRRPNLGRTLHPESAALLHPSSYDLAITITDGLSALAIERHAIPVLYSLLPELVTQRWTIAPITLVQHGRVAIGDPIGSSLRARCSLVFIGERPGLTSPDSMGAYLTWSPGLGRTDADRNCLSNIRHSGLSPKAAAVRLITYLQFAREKGKTGTSLKEDAVIERLANGPIGD